MGKNFSKFAIVGISAALAVSMAGCASPGKRTAIGAGAGGAVGAGLGAIVGGGKGALIGAGVGAVVGGAAGNQLDKQAAELEKVAETKRTEKGILVNLKDDLLFSTGSATLTPEAKTQLNQLSEVLVKYPSNQITVVGHTDDVGSDAFNKQLSKRRANAVKEALLEDGVPSSQLRAEGLGESDPLIQSTSRVARAKNRRVELKITNPLAQTDSD